MTGEVQVYGAANDLGIAGLEDFETNAVTIPRITIDHESDAGQFKDNLTGATYTTLRVVILGMIRQRILWPKKIGESDKPQCKSRNANQGYPVLDGSGKENYPFGSANLSPTDLLDDGNGNKYLPCKACNLKEWGGTKDDREPPRCSEQFTFVMQDEEGANMLYTVQRTGLTPAKKYLTSFVQRKKPMFVRWTELSVRVTGGAQRSYGVPVFTGGDDTDPNYWDDWALEFNGIKEFITRPPRGDGNAAEGDANQQAANTSSTVADTKPGATGVTIPGEVVAPQAAAVRPVSRPVAPPVAAADDDDDLPF